MNEAKRGVIVGCGYFAGIHLDAWTRLRDIAVIEACCDVRHEQAESRARKYGIPHVYTDYREMLEEQRPDFVDIVTRPDTHPEICRYVAGLGIPNQ